MDRAVDYNQGNGAEENRVAMNNRLTEGVWAGARAYPAPVSENRPMTPCCSQDAPGGALKELQDLLNKQRKPLGETEMLSHADLHSLVESNRSMLYNPSKLVAASSGLAMLLKSPQLAGASLSGFAGVQAYDDFKSFRDQKSISGWGKYSLGLAADSAVGAGAGAYLLEAIVPGKEFIPTKYKAALVVGGLVARAAIDLIPIQKK